MNRKLLGAVALTLALAACGNPPPRADVPGQDARAAMDKAFSQTDIGHRLRQALIPLMPKCEATVEKAAAALAMSPRSLQRRLGEAALRFQGVLDAVRRDMATIYLRDPGLSVLDVALLLGYAEQSSLTRSFRGWFRCTPSVWRRAQA